MLRTAYSRDGKPHGSAPVMLQVMLARVFTRSLSEEREHAWRGRREEGGGDGQGVQAKTLGAEAMTKKNEEAEEWDPSAWSTKHGRKLQLTVPACAVKSIKCWAWRSGDTSKHRLAHAVLSVYRHQHTQDIPSIQKGVAGRLTESRDSCC